VCVLFCQHVTLFQRVALDYRQRPALDVSTALTIAIVTTGSRVEAEKGNGETQKYLG